MRTIDMKMNEGTGRWANQIQPYGQERSLTSTDKRRISRNNVETTRLFADIRLRLSTYHDCNSAYYNVTHRKPLTGSRAYSSNIATPHRFDRPGKVAHGVTHPTKISMHQLCHKSSRNPPPTPNISITHVRKQFPLLNSRGE